MRCVDDLNVEACFHLQAAQGTILWPSLRMVPRSLRCGTESGSTDWAGQQTKGRHLYEDLSLKCSVTAELPPQRSIHKPLVVLLFPGLSVTFVLLRYLKGSTLVKLS